MTTKCLMKPESATQSMQTVFPNPTTLKKSVSFMNKLLGVSISNLTYLRGMLPERDYVDREFEGLHLKILTEKKGVASSAAQDLVHWIKGSLDAFEKGYLRQMILYIYPNEENPNTALESYTFSFMYSKAGNVLVSTTSSGSQAMQPPEATVDMNNLKVSIIKLLRNNYMLTQRMKTLPSEVMMAMKLYYYDEVTPEEYQPPFFKQCPASDIEYATEPLEYKIGKVSTPFHAVRLKCKLIKSVLKDCDLDSEDEASETIPPQDQSTVMEVEEEEEEAPENGHDSSDIIPPSQTQQSIRVGIHTPHSNQTQQERMKSPAEAHVPMDASPMPPASAVVMAGSLFEDDRSASTDFRNSIVHCPCGLNRESGLQLLCQVCNRWNHASCYRFLKMPEVPAQFYCIECHDPRSPSTQCSDLTLVPLTVDERKELCLYRHVLSICMETWRYSAEMIMEELMVPQAKAEKLMQRLDADSVFRPKRGTDIYRLVNKRILTTAVKKKYFTGDVINTGTNYTEDEPSSRGNTPVKGKRGLHHVDEPSSIGNTPVKGKRGLHHVLENDEEDEATIPPQKKAHVSTGIMVNNHEDAKGKPSRHSRLGVHK